MTIQYLWTFVLPNLFSCENLLQKQTQLHHPVLNSKKRGFTWCEIRSIMALRKLYNYKKKDHGLDLNFRNIVNNCWQRKKVTLKQHLRNKDNFYTYPWITSLPVEEWMDQDLNKVIDSLIQTSKLQKNKKIIIRRAFNISSHINRCLNHLKSKIFHKKTI